MVSRRRWTRFLPAMGLLLAACGGAELGMCPPDSAAAQTEGRCVMSRCLRCHSSMLNGAACQGAPPSLNFDNLETVRREGSTMYSEASGGEMPPGAPLGAAEVE